MDHQVFNPGLHVNPQEVKHILQEPLDATIPGVDTIPLDYGLCSMAVLRL